MDCIIVFSTFTEQCHGPEELTSRAATSPRTALMKFKGRLRAELFVQGLS